MGIQEEINNLSVKEKIAFYTLKDNKEKVREYQIQWIQETVKDIKVEKSKIPAKELESIQNLAQQFNMSDASAVLLDEEINVLGHDLYNKEASLERIQESLERLMTLSLPTEKITTWPVDAGMAKAIQNIRSKTKRFTNDPREDFSLDRAVELTNQLVQFWIDTSKGKSFKATNLIYGDGLELVRTGNAQAYNLLKPVITLTHPDPLIEALRNPIRPENLKQIENNFSLSDSEKQILKANVAYLFRPSNAANDFQLVPRSIETFRLFSGVIQKRMMNPDTGLQELNELGAQFLSATLVSWPDRVPDFLELNMITDPELLTSAFDTALGNAKDVTNFYTTLSYGEHSTPGLKRGLKNLLEKNFIAYAVETITPLDYIPVSKQYFTLEGYSPDTWTNEQIEFLLSTNFLSFAKSQLTKQEFAPIIEHALIKHITGMQTSTEQYTPVAFNTALKFAYKNNLITHYFLTKKLFPKLEDAGFATVRTYSQSFVDNSGSPFLDAIEGTPLEKLVNKEDLVAHIPAALLSHVKMEDNPISMSYMYSAINTLQSFQKNYVLSDEDMKNAKQDSFLAIFNYAFSQICRNNFDPFTTHEALLSYSSQFGVDKEKFADMSDSKFNEIIETGCPLQQVYNTFVLFTPNNESLEELKILLETKKLV